MQPAYPRNVLLGLGGLLFAASSASAQSNLEIGARAFQACIACHAIEPGRHMTGPSLAGIWGRKAGSVDGFARYSSALKSAGIVWKEDTLDAWLADPKSVIPGNRMTFLGVKDRRARAGLIAFLKAGGPPQDGAPTAQGGMMGGMMRPPEPEDLKSVGPSHVVTAIRYCSDTYRVTTADGETLPYWELNLRFKTDSTIKGPTKGKPAIMPAGMMGDRASVIFSDPTEISAVIEKKC